MTDSVNGRTLAAALALCSLLAACGGGGSAPNDDSMSAQDAGVAAFPEAVTAEAATSDAEARAEALRVRSTPVTTAAAATLSTTCGLANFQASVLARVNQYRAAGASCRTRGQFAPTQALVWNTKLLQAAAGHSIDMATNNYFSHTSKDGRTMVDRINATGYVWSTIGENIAAGYPSVNAVVDGWMASDGHCANLMNPAFKDVGMACVASSTSTYRTYWTMDLGKPR